MKYNKKITNHENGKNQKKYPNNFLYNLYLNVIKRN